MDIRKKHFCRKATVWALIASLASPFATTNAFAASMALSQTPLFLSSSEKANILVILDNSNSMDEDASGSAVGSASADSKSEISRSVVKDLVATYTGKINMGLMAYQQSAMSSYYLHNSPYDVSYDPANYDSSFSGARNSTTKKYRTPNPVDPGNYIYYNVALPFYASTNQGTGFCYSPTANAFGTTEVYPGGPWDKYRCFTSKTGTSDTLPTWADAASEAAQGYSGLIGTYTFSPTDSDLAQGILDFGKMNTWTYISKTWFSNSSPGRGYLHVPVALLDSTQAGKLNTKLGTSQFTSNKPTDPAYPLQNAGLTPIEGTLLTAKDYFAGNLTATAEGGPKAAPPNSCGKNFVVLVTDGLPSTDKDGNVVSDPTTAINAAAAAAAQLKAAGITAYVVGFALPYGTDPATLDKIAISGGSDKAYSATDLATLKKTLGDIFADITAKTGSASAVAASTTSLRTNTAVYQAKFDTIDTGTYVQWSGQLIDFGINSDGSVKNTPTWLAGAVEPPAPAYFQPLPAYDVRNIATYKPSTGLGIGFDWASIDASQQTAIGSSAVLDYLRGDGSNEGTSPGNYRPRPNGKLGDIVNSSPAYVGVANASYPDSIETNKYSDFITTTTSRTPMIYVGVNDGMLHAFNATTGVETFAYVPSKVYGNLASYASLAYTHRYFVDGSPTAADAYFGGKWHTVLVGGLNGGGQGIYALDITDPTKLTQANAANVVLWEFTDKDNTATTTSTDGDPDLGYTYSQPVVVKANNGKWVAIFGNGYNNTDADGSASTTGEAVLFVVDVQNGNLLAKITTKTGSTTTPNGLATPTAVDVNGDDKVDYVYAGDIQGNMWKFDLTSSSPGSWGPAIGSAAVPKPLYTAKDASGTPQPITVAPEVSLHPTTPDTYLVFFGTGKYVETGDNATTGTQTQTFYAIWDQGSTVASVTTRSSTNLLQQQILAEVTSSGSDWRLSSDNAIDWTKHHGWYLDLYNTQGGSTANYGEKQVSNPVLRNGRIIFTTLTPKTGVCTGGGSSWLMELDYKSGSRLPYTPFDVNGDGLFSSLDYLTGGTVTTKTATSGTRLGDGFTGTPTILSGEGSTEHKYMSKSTGDMAHVSENKGPGTGQVSWRELVDK